MRCFVIVGIVALMVCFCSQANASPFLTCDPYPGSLDAYAKPSSFDVVMDGGAAVSSPAKVNADGSVVLWHDLGAVSNGQHSIVVRAVNTYGGVSANSDPFVFTKSVPTRPANIRITTQ